MSFAVKDLDGLNFFLGVEVIPLQSGLLLSQRHYIMDLLKCTNMLEAKPISSPISYQHLLETQWRTPRSIVVRWVQYNIFHET
jgi:hypothetical protein